MEKTFFNWIMNSANNLRAEAFEVAPHKLDEFLWSWSKQRVNGCIWGVVKVHVCRSRWRTDAYTPKGRSRFLGGLAFVRGLNNALNAILRVKTRVKVNGGVGLNASDQTYLSLFEAGGLNVVP